MVGWRKSARLARATKAERAATEGLQTGRHAESVLMPRRRQKRGIILVAVVVDWLCWVVRTGGLF